MSTTYELACLDCKEVIWIGQNTHQVTPSTGEAFWYLYTGEPATMRMFHEFMRRHQSHSLNKDYDYNGKQVHRLVFVDSQVDFDDYTVVEEDGTRSKWGE